MMSPERAVRVDMVYVQDKSKGGGEEYWEGGVVRRV